MATAAFRQFRRIFLLVQLLHYWADAVIRPEGYPGCLSGAVPKAERRNIVLEGNSMPIGLAMFDWGSAPKLVSHMYRIIVEERLGLNTTITSASTSRTGLAKLAGCESSVGTCGKTEDTIPPPADQTVHVVQEAWSTGYGDYPGQLHEDIRPEHLGGVGYKGFESMYIVKKLTTDGIMSSPMLVLEHYKSYNSSMTDLRSFFSTVGDVPAAELKDCADTRLSDSARMETYLDLTNDADGVQTVDGKTTGKCWQDKWWFSPRCRTDTTRCIPMITGGATGWEFEAFMQKATTFDMPLALAVANSFDNYVQMPRSKDVLMYWWEPDITFMDTSATNVVFPFADAGAWLRGDKRTDYQKIDLAKFVHKDFSLLAWDAYSLLKNMDVNQPTIDELLLEAKARGPDQEDAVACEWLKANEATWEAWILDKRICRLGFGLIWPDGNFTQNFDNATDCTRCPPGAKSMPLKLEAGLTHYCELCPEGTFTDAFMSVKCHSCEQGKYTNQQGQSVCQNCQVGRFQSQPGMSGCDLCNASYTTQLLAAVQLSDCVCPQDHYFAHDVDGSCRPCEERATIGLDCPGGHSVVNRARDVTPMVQPGFMSMADDPLNLFTCAAKEACTSARDLADMTKMCPDNYDLTLAQCSKCQDGYFMSKHNCKKCSGGNAGALMAIKVIVGFILQFSVVVYLVVRANKPQKMGLISMTLLVTFIQVIQQIAQLPLLWPGPLKSMFLEIDIFSIDGVLTTLSLEPGCVLTGGFFSKILFDAIMPGTVIVHMAILVGLSWLTKLYVPLDHAINTTALIFKGLFITIISMCLQIFVPDVMPGGNVMVKMMPGLEFGSDDWTSGIAIGIISFIVWCVSFMAFIAHAVWFAPRWIATWPNFIVRYRFAFGALRPDRWWWCLFRIGYSLGLTLLQIVSRTVHTRIYLVTFLILGYTTLCYHFRPFKFEKNNSVELGLQGSLLFFLLIATSFIDSDLIDPSDLEKTRFDLAILACVLLGLGATQAAQGFVEWIYSMYHPPATSMGTKLALANQFRDVVTNILLLPDDAYTSSIMQLGEMDEQRLESVMKTLVPVFLKQQPDKFLLNQRLIANEEFRIWDKGEFSINTLQATAEGVFNERVSTNALQRVRLLQLAYDVTAATVGQQRKSMTKESAMRGDIGLEKSVEDLLNHVRVVFLDAGTAELTKQQFVEHQVGLTKLSRHDLDQLFDFLDIHSKGTVNFDEFASALIGTKSVLKSYSSELLTVLTSVSKARESSVSAEDSGRDRLASFGNGQDEPIKPHVRDDNTSRTQTEPESEHSPVKPPKVNGAADHEHVSIFLEDDVCENFTVDDEGAGPELSRHTWKVNPRGASGFAESTLL
eukprot:TRINITY_DN38239_c0_g2_i1.p1 TRINITY_DN38239_c0_g2~~TRINITY_DN38239_c0_g2_i1.p1  ORF type:complete len:1351 (-),score=280.55 TRINITY_DN38239_c0_g2_i1:300-4352(-)